uniref:Uncharacterized protein n=1 Tax=Guillardia theta TaxID=55529 RepID=A0A7S4PCR2_GUITH
MAPPRTFTAATAATVALCACIAVIQMRSLPSARLQVGDQFSEHSKKAYVALPDAGSLGTDKAFIGKGDGSGQSTKDKAKYQMLAGGVSKAPHNWLPWAKPVAVHKKHWRPTRASKLVPKYTAAKKQHMLAMKMQRMGHLRAARPVFSSDTPGSMMGTNDVFLGAHQGGDPTFSTQSQVATPRLERHTVSCKI